MKWVIKLGDILNEEADVLVCSANVYLNLSGGVGGEILRRYGMSMQDELRHYLVKNDIVHVKRGTIVTTGSCGTRFGAVLHAVAVDVFYESTREVISHVVNDALERAATMNVRYVALVALATGYGRLSMTEFGLSILALAHKKYQSIERIVVCVPKQDDVDELLAACSIATRA